MQVVVSTRPCSWAGALSRGGRKQTDENPQPGARSADCGVYPYLLSANLQTIKDFFFAPPQFGAFALS
jgi:hypothetical protein